MWGLRVFSALPLCTGFYGDDMYQITALRTPQRISLARQGKRLRRLPFVVLSGGEVIKLSPGQSVTISRDTYTENKLVFEEFNEAISIKELVALSVKPEVAAPIKAEKVEVSAPTKTEVAAPIKVKQAEVVAPKTIEKPRRRGRPKVNAAESVPKTKSRRMSRKKAEPEGMFGHG